MKTIALSRHPRWPLICKLRRQIQRELAAAGGPATEDAAAEYLREHSTEVFAELAALMQQDLAERTARAGREQAAAALARSRGGETYG
jgi:hypothetical protein